MAKREAPEINAGSMADIAFLLLIFFLVTTTMDSSYGIPRILPPIEEEPEPDQGPKLKDRNLLIVLVNGQDQLLVEGEPMEIDNLKGKVKEFILNENNDPNLPEFKTIKKQEVDAKVMDLEARVKVEKDEDKLKNLNKSLKKARAQQLACEIIGGNVKVSKGIISMQNVDQTSYGTYVKVQDEMASAYYEIRNELSKEKFGKPFILLDEDDENDEIKIDAIKLIYPKLISEAEPVRSK